MGGRAQKGPCSAQEVIPAPPLPPPWAGARLAGTGSCLLGTCPRPGTGNGAGGEPIAPP